MLIESLLVGGLVGVIGYSTKEVVKIILPKKEGKNENDFDGFPDDEIWESIWFYNGVIVKPDKDSVECPFLLGKCLTSLGARYMFKMPVGITTKKMETCSNEIRERFNALEVEVKHYKDDLAIVEIINKYSEGEEMIKYSGSIDNDKWEQLWDACSIKTGDKDSGFRYPILVEEVATEFGRDFMFQFPVGLSTFKVDKVDITIKEFLSARGVSIIPLSGNKMCISAVYKELPTFSQYVQIPRSERGSLEVVIGESINGFKKLDLLSGIHNVFVGGAVGSGKSVAINVIITDLAVTYSPKYIEMWLYDLKVIELSHFKKLKHVQRYGNKVYELMKAIDDLSDIMWDRYDLFEEKEVKTISAYNSLVEESEKLPYILLVIEEIYEFTTDKKANDSKENYIDRLAVLLSKCRSAGIIVICTSQRLVNAYIPRNISANLVNRVCFRVSDKKESALLTDDKFDATSLKGKGHGCIIDKNIEEFQSFFLDEDKKEVTNLLKKYDLLREDV